MKYEVLGPAVSQKAPLESPKCPRQGPKSGLEGARNRPKRPLESLLAIMEKLYSSDEAFKDTRALQETVLVPFWGSCLCPFLCLFWSQN